MDLEIKRLENKDLGRFIALIRVFEEVFEMEGFQLPSEKHLQQLLGKEGFLVFVALFKGEVVAGLTAYTLAQYYSERPLVYIYDLAVMSPHQRQGIGKRLM